LESSLKSGVCPKCNAQEVYSTENDRRKIVPHKFMYSTSWENRLSPVVDNYVCGNCGYAEFYVRPNELKTVKETWERKQAQ
jgi:predicted nucleic-acid-binding Zn-ribbon protein